MMVKNDELMPFGRYMDGPRDDHTQQSKSERERQISYDITYIWSLKYNTNQCIYKTKIDLLTKRTDLWLPRAGGIGLGRTGSLGLAEANY